MPRLIIGAPVKDREWALQAWFEGIRASEGEYPVLALCSPSEDATEASLANLGVEVVQDPEPGRPLWEIDNHGWGTMTTYAYMARLRNQLIELMIERDAEYFFSLDTDIILPADAITALLAVMEASGADVIAPAVNMAIRAISWNTMNWDSMMPGSAIRTFVPQRAGPVDVVMAAMLLNRRAMERCRWAPHMQGEDVGFCINAVTQGISRWWCPEIRCTHLMNRSWLPVS
jgi:hypothetical protein